VSQIDYVPISSGLAQRVENLIGAEALYLQKRDRIPGVECQGLVLPKQAKSVHFERDEVTPLPASFTPTEKVDFRFDRYDGVMQAWVNYVSDHCPVKVWF